MTDGIGVIMPVFNGEQYLAEAIESVHSQTLQPVELIVVDDGSTDRSADIAGSLGATVIRQGHAGNGAALNRGVETATASILAFLDADDVWPSRRCESLAALLRTDRSLGAAVGNIDEFVSPELTGAERARLRAPNLGMHAALASALLIRRSAFKLVGPFDEGSEVGAGFEWASRMSQSGIRLGRVAEVVLLRRLHLRNSSMLLRENLGAYARVLKRRLDAIRHNGESR